MPYNPSVKETREILDVFVCCLQKLYKEAGINLPKSFNASREAKKLIKALAKK